MPLPAVTVARADFSIEEPWAMPPGSQQIQFVRSTDGKPPRMGTTVTLYVDSECLNLLYRAHDDNVVATYLGHDEQLYQEDVVEAFLAPDDIRRYYEIEVNPLGTTFDARIDSPDGVRATMHVDLAWDCEDLFAAVRKTSGMVETIMRIPFASLGVPRPEGGTEWRGNFFRVDRGKNPGDEFTAWSPTMKSPPDFHVAAAFGRIVFA
jgi:hypothetical protein